MLLVRMPQADEPKCGLKSGGLLTEDSVEKDLARAKLGNIKSDLRNKLENFPNFFRDQLWLKLAWITESNFGYQFTDTLPFNRTSHIASTTTADRILPNFTRFNFQLKREKERARESIIEYFFVCSKITCTNSLCPSRVHTLSPNYHTLSLCSAMLSKIVELSLFNRFSV